MNQDEFPIGSVWHAWHSQGEDIVLVLGDPEREAYGKSGMKGTYVPCLVMTTGQYIETWIANFTTWERLL